MPTVGVHFLGVNEKNELLLVKRNYLEKDWVPPGGIMEDGESIYGAVIREVQEESGFTVEPRELFLVGSRPSTNDVIICLTGNILSKTQSSPDPAEISDIGFFSPSELPKPIKQNTIRLIELFYSGRKGLILEI